MSSKEIPGGKVAPESEHIKGTPAPSVRFSESIRKDLGKIPIRAQDESRAEIASMILCAYSGRTEPDRRFRLLTTSSTACAERLVRLLRDKQIRAEILSVGKTSADLAVVTDLSGHREIVALTDAFRRESAEDDVTSSTRIRRGALRGAFMACGTAADPRRAYQIELHVKDPVYAHALMLLLHAEDIEPSLLFRNGRNILYFKEGAQIADFLAMIGAHISLLHFENVRTDKEIRNQVNRMVNCDTANALRQAEAGARRGERLRVLLMDEGAARLPQELKDAAEVLINNPGLSIKELGEMMDPPITKSGMHHRLRKLEKHAEEMEG